MLLEFTAEQIAALTRPQSARGACHVPIRGIAALSEAVPGDLSFLGNGKYKAQVASSRASLILVPTDFEGEPAADQQFLFVENPSASLAIICGRIEQSLWPKPTPGIHPSAVVAPNAVIHPSATIGPLCVVEPGAVIGERAHLQAQVFVGRAAQIGPECWLMPGVTVTAECRLGARVRLHAGVVVGSDGFGYEFTQGRHEKVPQVGHVVIGDDVEIGANSTLDRARFSRTEVGAGTKIDNLVQIAHNVVIGRHCLICAQVGIAGSTTLGDYVVLGGQAGLAGHLKLGQGARVGGGAGVTADVAAGAYVNGHPAMPYMLERRIAVLQQRLPELFRRVSTLETAAEKSSS